MSTDSRSQSTSATNRVSVVVPVYYNETTIPSLCARLLEICKTNSDLAFEFVFVDDSSGDGSYQILRTLASSDPRIKVIKLSRNFGANNAVLAGLTYSMGDCVAVMSADLQDPPELIPEMVEHWKKGSKVVLAARKARHDPYFSKLFANTFNWLFKRLVLSDFPSQGFDFVLVDRRVAQLLVQCQEKNTNLMALILWFGFKRSMVYYIRGERTSGRSRWTFGKKLKYFADSFVGFSYLPLRAASIVGIALAFLGFIYAFIVIASRLLWSTSIEGWSSLMVVLLVVSGTQLLMFGIIGEYLWRNLDETRRRPPFLIDEAMGITELDQVQTLAQLDIRNVPEARSKAE